MDNLLPTSLKNVPHFVALDKMARHFLYELDLGVILIYLIDYVPASALPALADQFGVLGYKGWFLTTNDDDRRELIKNAIELYKYKGTPYAIRQALASVGFGDCVITEGVDGHWAKFSVTWDMANYTGSEDTTAIVALINEYKNARSTLTTAAFTTELSDNVVITDTSLTITAYVPFLYNGDRRYDGTWRYGDNPVIL